MSSESFEDDVIAATLTSVAATLVLQTTKRDTAWNFLYIDNLLPGDGLKPLSEEFPAFFCARHSEVRWPHPRWLGGGTIG